MLRKFILPALVSLLLSGAVLAQDTLYMMSGRVVSDVEVMRMDSNYVYFLRQNQRTVNSQGRIKPSVKRRIHIYEIRYENGTSELAYLQDTADYYLNPDQMLSYVDGCHDALSLSHDRLVGPVCYAITLGSFLVLDPFYVVAVPALYSGVIAIFTPKFPENIVDESKVNKYYIMGFQDTKKNKKVKSSVLFGIGGLITGFGLYFLSH